MIDATFRAGDAHREVCGLVRAARAVIEVTRLKAAGTDHQVAEAAALQARGLAALATSQALLDRELNSTGDTTYVGEAPKIDLMMTVPRS